MDAVVDEELLGDLSDVSEASDLLVACGFDGVLAEPTDDPGAARAEQESSEALNVLLALPRTTVFVVSRRAPDDVAELMFLSGAKGGLTMITPEELATRRDEQPSAAMIVVDADLATLAAARPGDLVIAVSEDEVLAAGDDEAVPVEVRRVPDALAVIDILVELADLRRHR